MKSETSVEKSKPFRLVKYFTFTSLIVIFLGTIVLSLLNTRLARSLQLKKTEDYALLLVENLNHQIFLQFIIPIALKYGRILLRNPEQFEHMDKVVRTTLHSFKIEKVNIYDKSNTISYSFDPQVIGRKNAGGTGFQNALAGKSTSKLVQRGGFWQVTLGFPKESKLITFAPLRAEKPLSRISGPVVGVVEIVQDMAEDDKTIIRFQIPVIVTCSAIMCVLFLVLLLVVKRGEAIFEKRAQERLRLKERLSRAEHLSSLGEMVAGVSHEIRNPLGIIQSSAELLKKKMALYDPTNTIPNIIVEESGRLNLIITDFLNFARPRLPQMVPCQVDDVVEKNITFLEPQLKARPYRILKDYESPIPSIAADPEMLYQAFLNILINALQAMSDGGDIRVAISVDQDARQVVVLIEDQGEGIEENLRAKIWDPFFTTKDKGTGLGLGIVKNIIGAHGGAIEIENKPDRGVRVAIRLPQTESS